jgi:hypothetical protein
MTAKDYLNQLPKDFNTQVLRLSDKLGMDSALYLKLGEYLPELDENDYDLVDELEELIIDKWNELEY